MAFEELPRHRHPRNLFSPWQATACRNFACRLWLQSVVAADTKRGLQDSFYCFLRFLKVFESFPKVLPNEIERHITIDFSKGQIAAIVTNPLDCCFFYCCAPCAVYSQRRDLLELTGEPYVCCAGTCPCLGFEKYMADG